ncbi:MAG: T9SS type A sorting domain-containing protein [Nitrospira sp.]|nr:T9SS type A sorting domain-containing protein [Nitrospira sp.]
MHAGTGDGGVWRRLASVVLLLALVVWPSVARPADDESPLICERSPRTGRPDCWPRVLVEAQGAATARPELPAGAALTLLVVRPLGPFDLRPQDRSPAERMHDAFFGTGDLADLERDLSDDRAAGRAPLLVRDLVTIGIWLMRRGNYDAAGRRLDEAVTVADRHGDPALRGAARLDRGVLLAIQGRYAEALASTQGALVSYRKAAELMYDLTGRVVFANTTKQDVMNMNIQELANGIYYLKVKSNNTVETVKIVKQ